jgi:fido (protein-threonine AMPylation protein)
MVQYTKEEITEFIRESNAIEDVWDEQAIKDSLESWEWLNTEVSTLTLKDILIVHHGILRKIDPTIAGKLRGELGVDVWIGGKQGARYWDVGSRLCDWIRHVNDKKMPQWTEEDIKRMHISFEEIHPFADGNGRCGRLIYCWMRQAMDMPIHIIYEKEKHDYYNWFRR